MAFKPYPEAGVLNRTGTRQVAFRSSQTDSAHSSGFSRSTFVGWLPILGGLLLLTFTAAAQVTQPGNTSPAATVHHAAAGTTASSPTGKKTTPEKAHTRRHVRHKARHPRQAKPIAPVIVAPVAPPPPVPPAEQAAHPATVEFSHGNLRIDANNSSLVQILNQVSHQTGLDVEGLGNDQRIYGQYGPGPMSGTLMKLLDGSGYNYILVGGGADHPPTKLLLTPEGNAPASTPPTASNSTPVTSQPANPSEPTQPKTPQQIFEELREMHPHPPR